MEPTKKRLNAFGIIGSAAVVVLVLVVNLRACVVTVWTPPREAEHYLIKGEDGRTLEAYFFADRHTILWYTDPRVGVSEGTLSYTRGSVGDHYIGNLWHVRKPGSLLDFGFYPSGCKPSVLELQTLARHHTGSGQSTFPPAGRVTTSVVSFCHDRIYFQGMPLLRADFDRAETSNRRGTLEAAVKR